MDDAEQHSAARTETTRIPMPSGSGRAALAATVVSLGMLACAPASAASWISSRINATFDLVLPNAAEPIAPLARHAAKRRSLQDGITVAALPYRGLATPLAPGGAAGAEISAFDAIERNLGLHSVARLPKPRPTITGSVVPDVVAAADPAEPESDYLNRFTGAFAGSGRVLRNARARPNQVTCSLAGKPTANGVSISGKCGAFVFSRNISAEIRYDPASGRYTGTYVGAAAGPAKLSGSRSGDTVVLTITWPKPVNGDTDATMTIHNPGDGQLAISVTDRMEPGGPTAEVTRLALNR